MTDLLLNHPGAIVVFALCALGALAVVACGALLARRLEGPERPPGAIGRRAPRTMVPARVRREPGDA